MVLIKDILFAIWQALLSLVQYFSERTAAAGITVEWPLIVVLLGGMTAWLVSGCWASSIASSRRHSPLLSFVLGLGVPYVYPVIILFAMDIRGAKERRKKQDEAKAKDAAAQDERRHVAELVGREMLVDDAETDEELTPACVFDAAYFERIARDEQGNQNGPWRVIFGGTEVKVLRIVEPLAEVVSVEIETRDGGQAKFRIPYARITECEPC
jgi:hypothetical protein